MSQAACQSCQNLGTLTEATRGILLLPAKHLASSNKPPSDRIYEMLCLPRNESTLFKDESEGSLNVPLPDNVLVLLKIMCPPWSNPCFGVATQVTTGREQHLHEQTGHWRSSSYSIHTKKEGERYREVEEFQILLWVLKSTGDSFLGKVEFSGTVCFPSSTVCISNCCRMLFSLVYMQKGIQKGPQRSHDYCDELHRKNA